MAKLYHQLQEAGSDAIRQLYAFRIAAAEATLSGEALRVMQSALTLERDALIRALRARLKAEQARRELETTGAGNTGRHRLTAFTGLQAELCPKAHPSRPLRFSSPGPVVSPHRRHVIRADLKRQAARLYAWILPRLWT